MSDKPKYEHDCNACVFLGSCKWEEKVFDLYACMQGRNWPTIIARASSKAFDYESGIIVAKMQTDKTHPLAVALERAKERGFLKRKDFA